LIKKKFCILFHSRKPGIAAPFGTLIFVVVFCLFLALWNQTHMPSIWGPVVNIIVTYATTTQFVHL
jgi:hypothetical protein